MKSRFIPSAFILLTMLSIMVTGCLKDSDYDNGSIQSVHTNGAVPKIIELKLSANDASNFFVLSVANSPNDTTVKLVPVNLATADPAPQDLHVTVVLDSTIIDAYDTANQAAYTLPPPASYTILNQVVTIPKGSHTGYISLKFNIPDFLGQNYALAFRITKIQEPGYIISGNLSTGMVPIGVKNQYDGIYNTTIVLVHPSAGGNYGGPSPFVTVNSNTIQCNLGVALIFGSNMNITVNADNSLTLNGPVAIVEDPGGNYYDPAAKTFHFSYGWGGGTRHVSGTAVYKSSR